MSTPSPEEIGFRGYTGCPIEGRCDGSLAGNCMASGSCLVELAVAHLNHPGPCDAQKRYREEGS